MSIAVLALLGIVAVAVVALQAAMFIKDASFYGVLSIFLIGGPGVLLAAVYLAIA